MECPINLATCDTYCNEKQIFPAMRYFVEEMDLAVNAAAKEVYNLTSGLVTQSRAREVWRNRTVRLGKQPTEKQNQPEAEQKQEVTAEPDSVEVNKEIAKEVAKGTAGFIRAEKKEEKEKEKETARKELLKKTANIDKSDRWNIYHADMQDWKCEKEYDFIITDPPYKKKFLPLYEVLSIRADEWLKEGGLLIAMCGQSYLNQIYEMMCKYLDYYWTAAYLTPGQPKPLRQRNVNTTWKPLLIFSKGKYTGKIFGDVFKSDGNDKSLHEWGQSISGMFSITKMLCAENQIILDPFCGAGTTGIAALMQGCLFDGLELDKNNVEISNARLTEYDAKEV